jgi:glycosyltransferase involved in cell wall biosynthesis
MKYGVAALYDARGGSLRRLQQFADHAPGLLRPDESIVLFLSDRTRKALELCETQRMRAIVLPVRDRGYAARTLNEQWFLPRLMRRERIDALLSTANTMPLTGGVPCAVLFQNAAPFCPPMPSEPSSVRDLVRQALLRRLILLSARRATRLIFLSQSFRDVIRRNVESAPSRGDIVYVAREDVDSSGVDGSLPRALLAELEGRRLYLVVSHIYPHKNLIRLVDAFVAATGDSDAAPLLLIAGDPVSHDYSVRLKRRLAEIDPESHAVRVVGGVSRDGVQALLGRAEAFLFSSVCENCPNSLIEALSAGLAIGAARTPVIKEVADDAALYFDPYDVEGMTSAIHTLIVDTAARSELSRRALQRAAIFPSAADVAASLLTSLRLAAQQA